MFILNWPPYLWLKYIYSITLFFSFIIYIWLFLYCLLLSFYLSLNIKRLVNAFIFEVDIIIHMQQILKPTRASLGPFSKSWFQTSFQPSPPGFPTSNSHLTYPIHWDSILSTINGIWRVYPKYNFCMDISFWAFWFFSSFSSVFSNYVCFRSWA